MGKNVLQERSRGESEALCQHVSVVKISPGFPFGVTVRRSEFVQFVQFVQF